MAVVNATHQLPVMKKNSFIVVLGQRSVALDRSALLVLVQRNVDDEGAKLVFV